MNWEYSSEMERPETFSEAIQWLHSHISERDKEWIKEEGQQAVVSSHHGLGRKLRNDWELWGDSPLANDLRRIGFTHADDMCEAILRRFVCEVIGEP